MKTERCLVTGSSGFLGRHLCDMLAAAGVEVTGIDCRCRPGSQAMGRFVLGDLSTAEEMDELDWDSFDAVFHLAAAGAASSAREWPMCTRVNVLGTLNLLHQLNRASRPPVLIYARTFYEDHLTSAPILSENPYVLTKYIASRLVREFSAHYRGPVVLTKLFQVYGPGDNPAKLIPYVIECLRNGVPARLGSGRGRRDWLYVSDLANGLVAAWQAARGEGRAEFDLGTGSVVSIREVLAKIATILHCQLALLDFDPRRDRGDQDLESRAENGPKGWQPKVLLDEGLELLCKETGLI